MAVVEEVGGATDAGVVQLWYRTVGRISWQDLWAARVRSLRWWFWPRGRARSGWRWRRRIRRWGFKYSDIVQYSVSMSILCCWSHARQTRCKLYFVNCIVTTSRYVVVVFTFKNTVQFPSLYFAEKPSFVIGFGFEQQCESSGVWKFLWKMLQSSWQEAKLSLG